MRTTWRTVLLFVVTGCGGAVKPAALTATSSRLTLTAEPSADLVASRGPTQLAVRIRIQAPPLPDAARPPLNLALVLDTSASMEGEAIEQVKAAAHAIVDEMSSRDRLGVVTFSSRAEVAIESTVLDERGRRAAHRAIASIKAYGTTDLAGGIAAGLRQIAAHRRHGGIDRIVLLADGFPNDPAPIPSLVQSAATSGIAITTLGIGIEHSQEMLAGIARDTGGVYRYAPDGTEIAAVFEKELLRIHTLVARDMSLRIVGGPGVEFGPAPWLTESGRDRWVSLGDLAAGEIRDVMVPLRLPGHRAGLTVELLDANLSFSDAVSGAPHDRSVFVGVRASDDAAAVKRSTRIDLMIAQARAEAAGAIIQAINLARGGSVDQAHKLLAAAEKAARSGAAQMKDTDLAELADRIKALGRDLAQIQARPAVTTNRVQPGSDPLTDVPAAAPPSVEPAIRETYDEAARTLDSR